MSNRIRETLISTECDLSGHVNTIGHASSYGHECVF